MNAPLFEGLKPNYAAAAFPPPREFQVSAQEPLRQGIFDGVADEQSFSTNVRTHCHLCRVTQSA